MLHFFTHLFDTEGFPPRWHCGVWTSGHGWLHIISDVLIWGAYSAIPIVLGYFVWRRKDVPFSWLFCLFAMFIFACGTTHLIDASLFWHPAYRLSGLMKLTTAIVSWATVAALIPIIPQALALPSRARFNDQLRSEVQQRTLAEEQLRTLNQRLEQAVVEKVADLRRSEHQLRLAQQAARLGTWEIEPVEKRIRCSPEFLRQYDLPGSASDLSIEEWLSHVHPDDRQRARRDLQRALSGEGAYESEFRILREDGTVNSILGQGELRGADNGTPETQRLVGIHLDITHRRELEDAIAQQVDEEKQRISQELHDGLGQQITGLGFLVKSLERTLAQQQSPLATQAGELSQAIPGIVRDLRRVVHGLMPVEVGDLGLVSALDQLATVTTSRSGLICRLKCSGDVEVNSRTAAQQLYRIAQEAVHNAVKHADATEIEIDVRGTPSSLQIEVRDNGQGIPPTSSTSSGMGMKILRHRAARLGAKLTISPGDLNGTVVCCQWSRSPAAEFPLSAEGEDPDC